MNTRTTALSIALLAALAGSAFGQVQQVRLKVDGISCPFCIYNMEKRLKKLDGLDKTTKIESSLKTGITVVPWSPSKVFDPAPVRQAIKDSGFTLRAIDLTATGELPAMPSVTGASIDFEDAVTGEVYHLVEAARADHRQSWKELLAYLADPANDRSVRVEGRVATDDSASSSDRWNLELTNWAPTEFGAEVYLKVKGFQCEKCAARTMKTLGAFDDVIHLEANHEDGLVHVWTKSKDPDVKKICARIDKLGFQCTHADSHAKGDETHDMSDRSIMTDMPGMSEK